MCAVSRSLHLGLVVRPRFTTKRRTDNRRAETGWKLDQAALGGKSCKRKGVYGVSDGVSWPTFNLKMDRSAKVPEPRETDINRE